MHAAEDLAAAEQPYLGVAAGDPEFPEAPIETRGILRDDGRGAPQYQILGVRGSRGPYRFRARNSIFSSRCGVVSGKTALPSGPPAPRFRRPKRRGSRDRRSALPARPSPGAPRAAPRPIGCKRRQAERLRRNRTLGPSPSGRRRENKYRTTAQPCQEIVGFFEAGESTPVSTAIPGAKGPRRARHNRRCPHQTRKRISFTMIK